jgi:diguanylate cyclase (GGDEF)-like protein/PAS domain S-box-containing protein
MPSRLLQFFQTLIRCHNFWLLLCLALLVWWSLPDSGWLTTTGLDTEAVISRYRHTLYVALGGALLIVVLVLRRVQAANLRMLHIARRQELLLASLGEGVYGVDRQGMCTFINTAALEMLGYTQDDVVGQDPHLLFHHHDNEGNAYPHQDCPTIKTLQDGLKRQGEEFFFHKSGQRIPVRVIITPMREQGVVIGSVVAFQDMTESKQADADLRIAAVAFEAQEGMVITDRNNRIIRVNKAFTEVTGYSAEEAIGNSPSLLRSGRHDDAYYQEMWQDLQSKGRWHGEIWNRRKNGEVYPEWLTITAVRDAAGRIGHFVAAFLDISHRKEAEDKIHHLALYDPLTQLPNRSLLYERIAHTLSSFSRNSGYAALLFIDMDNFKTLNDSFGHDMGDLLLQQIAKRLKHCIRESDTVSRIGGDEFVIMLENLGPNAQEAGTQARLVAEKIIDAINEPFLLREHEYHTTPSLGIALFHDQRIGLEELLQRADLAMYQAKSAGRNTLCFFDPQMQAAIQERVALESDLRQALKQQDFLLYYQPQVNAAGEVTGAEALVRWPHPARGMVSPGVFIPVAESTGLILPLGQQVLEMACRQLVQWQQQPQTRHLSLAVNVSAHQFRQDNFVAQVKEVVERTGIRPEFLKLELTETLLLDDSEAVIERMAALRQLGIRFALDDFGTGYSSLSYLKRLPLDQLKIDQSFVRDVLSDPNDAVIAKTVLALGQSLGLAVIAEGVETEAQRDFLLAHGCTNFQGYLFGRPMPSLPA